MNDDFSRLQIYRRILAHVDADDARRTHHRTQDPKPRQARQWLAAARRVQTALRLLQHDERFRGVA
jgi:hypothetical protein